MGLTVRRLKKFNISLLGRWVWRVLHERESLWHKVLGARYGEEGGRWIALVYHNGVYHCPIRMCHVAHLLKNISNKAFIK